MLKELKEMDKTMFEQNKNRIDRNYKSQTEILEKWNNWNEKFTTEIQQQMGAYRRKNPQTSIQENQN